jgi:hypothetical protein
MQPTTDPVRGHTIRWTYDDGPMKGKEFEHNFSIDGHVTYRMVDDKSPSTSAKPAAKSEAKPAKTEAKTHASEAKTHASEAAKPATSDAPSASAKKPDQPDNPAYQVAPVSDDVYAVSYLASSGYTLTTVLDFKHGTLVSFASNEKDHSLLHGHFETVRATA